MREGCGVPGGPRSASLHSGPSHCPARPLRERPALFTLSVLLLAACQRESPPQKPQLVIEGWIENGDYPHVAITTSLPVVFGKEITTPELVEHVARDAVVTVSDGEKTVLGASFNMRAEGTSVYDAMIDGAKGYWVGYGVDEVKQIKV